MEEIVASASWRDRLAIASRRKEIWIVAGVAAAAAVVPLLMWMRGPSPRVAPPATATAVASAPSVAQPSPPAALIYVHVAGAVRRPGLYEFEAGTRVASAIETAGGPRSRADLDAINLAEVLVDGVKIDIPVRGSTPAPVALPSAAAPGTSPAGLVDLNVADQAALETIPGIGPVTAVAILQFRDERGGFSSVEELLDVSGIGPATLEEIRPYVSV